MSGGILGVAGDILSVAFLCFICSLAIQLYCAFRRRRTRPPTPLPTTIINSPPPAAACKQLHLLRFQRSASCPVVSTIAPPLSPPNKLSSAYHVNTMAASEASPLACTVASQAHTADLAELMRLESGEEHDVDAENFICVPPRMLFTIKEESPTEQCANVVASVEEGRRAESTYRNGPATTSTTCVQAPGQTVPAGLVSQVSSASSEGGVSLWSTSPCSSSPAVSYLSASSSPFPTTSPPRSSFWAQTSTLPHAKAR